MTLYALRLYFSDGSICLYKPLHRGSYYTHIRFVKQIDTVIRKHIKNWENYIAKYPDGNADKPWPGLVATSIVTYELTETGETKHTVIGEP